MSEIVFLTFKNQMKKLNKYHVKHAAHQTGRHVMWSKKDKMIGAANNGKLEYSLEEIRKKSHIVSFHMEI